MIRNLPDEDQGMVDMAAGQSGGLLYWSPPPPTPPPKGPQLAPAMIGTGAIFVAIGVAMASGAL